MTDGLPNGLTDKSDEVWTEGNFPMYRTFGKFHPAKLKGIFTENFADGWTDGTHDRHTDDAVPGGIMFWLTDIRQTSHVTVIWMDLSWY